MPRTHRRILIVASGLLVTAAVCAIIAIAVTDSGSRTEPDSSRSDPNIEYPEALSDLPFPPGALAIDASSGDLWLLGLASDGRTKELLRYSSSDGTLHRRTVPTSAGLYSAMAVDSRGHVILAQGGFVLDVDPEGGYVEYEPPPGGHFTDIAISDDDKAYVSKEYVATIIEIDLRTGEITERPLPASIYRVHYVALAGDRLWMTAPISTEDLPAQTAVLDLETGQTEVIPLKASALGRRRSGPRVRHPGGAAGCGGPGCEGCVHRSRALDVHQGARWATVGSTPACR